MKKQLICGLLALSACTLFAQNRSGSKAISQADINIKGRLQMLQASENKQDAKAIEELFDLNAELSYATGKRVKGNSEIARAILTDRGVWSERGPVVFKHEEVRFVAPKTAAVSFEEHVSTSVAVDMKSICQAVLVKSDRWRIVRMSISLPSGERN